MKKEINKPNDLFKDALNDIQKAIQDINFTVDMLKNTQKNMKDSITNLNSIKQNHKDFLYSYHGINSIEEKISQIKEEYETFIIESDKGKDLIVFQPQK